MIEEGKIVLEPRQKRIIKVGEAVIFHAIYFSLLIPFVITVAIMHPIEPTHVLFKEWFDIEFEFTLPLFPIMAILWMAVYGCASIVTFQTIVIAWIYVLHTISMECFTPERVGRVREGRLCDLETPGYGTLSDYDVILLYRVQQVLNGFLNEFFRSVLVSFHHIACLATVVVLLVFAVKYDQVLANEGATGYAVVIACILVPLIIIFNQCWMCGDIVDKSQSFKRVGETLLARKFAFRKFAISCRIFYVEVAYPFYSIHKETFLLFCEQILDFTVSLLLDE